MTEKPLTINQITVVCTGNICRSPMGEIILADALAKSDNPDHHRITVNSCGTGDWHVGDPADPRAVKELEKRGYDGSKHVAATFGPEHEKSNIFLAMDRSHYKALLSKGYPPYKLHFFRGFDAQSVTMEEPTPEVADPYYGTDADFATVADQLEAAVPGILDLIDFVNEGDY